MSAGLLLLVFWKRIAVGLGRMDGQETWEFVFMRIYCVRKLLKKNTSEA
jgi:hypothetical protein